MEHSLLEFNEQLVRFETSDAINGSNLTINQSDTKLTGKPKDDSKKRKASEDPVPQDQKPKAKKNRKFFACFMVTRTIPPTPAKLSENRSST